MNAAVPGGQGVSELRHLGRHLVHLELQHVDALYEPDRVLSRDGPLLEAG